MNTQNTAPSPFPRTALLVAFAMVALSLAGAAYKSWVDPLAPAVLPATAVIETRSLRFEDTAAGQVAVIDDDSGEVIEFLDVGTNGFLRATLRGLARARHAAAKGPDIPFVVERRADGQVLLIDPAIDRFIDLRAFGPANSAVFTRYLEQTPTNNSTNLLPRNSGSGTSAKLN